MKKSKRKSKSFNWFIYGFVGLFVLLVLINIYYSATRDPLGAGSIRYDVGEPGMGEIAPDFTLSSVSGNSITLSDYSDEYTLLYFQEGIMCQACWVQLQHIEQAFDQFKAEGIDKILTITTDPLGPLAQKVALERIHSEVLSDQSISVSNEYTTTLYGMMGTNYNGHSFILVNPDREIVWRADYGGAPEYTMYVPIEVLLADLAENRIDTPIEP